MLNIWAFVVFKKVVQNDGTGIITIDWLEYEQDVEIFQHTIQNGTELGVRRQKTKPVHYRFNGIQTAK